MTPEPAIDIVELLEESLVYFEGAIESVPVGDAARKPAPDAWSVLEIVEHVTLAERAMVGQLMKSGVGEGGARDHAKEANIDGMVRNRGTRIQAPERAHPAGRFETLEIAQRQFAAARAQTLQFARERGPALTRISGQHMRFGPVNGIEMLVIVAGHSFRHADQIRALLGP